MNLDVDDVLRRVQRELERRGAVAEPIIERIPMPQLVNSSARVPSLNPPLLPDAMTYRLDDLLAYHDGVFIEQAYLALLKRGPDLGGVQHYLGALRSAALGKIEILGRLRYSPEGRARGVRVTGLLLPFALQHLMRQPVIGYPIALGNLLLRLPVMARNVQRFEAHSAMLQTQMGDAINRNADEADRRRAHLDEHTQQLQRHAFAKADGESLRDAIDAMRVRAERTEAALDATLAHERARVDALARTHAPLDALNALRERMDAVDGIANGGSLAQRLQMLAEQAERSERERVEMTLSLRAQLDALAEQLQGKTGASELNEHARQIALALSTVLDLQQRVDALKDCPAEIERVERRVLGYRHALLDTQRRTTLLLEEARKRLPAPIAPEQLERLVAEQDHQLDAFYATFEDEFRGTRDDIKQRAAYYLPLIEQAGAGTADAPVLDLGCGRGEWLELMREHGRQARGIDLNRVMISQCRELGLQVEEVDAIEFLRRQPANSLGAVTAMHLIEHLPMTTLITLFDEALRVLRPGGIVIFETPNPENVSVGACTFYLDPTHRNPLPPALSQFIAEARGFVDAQIHRLAEHRGPQPELAVLDDTIGGAAQANAVFARVHHLIAAAGDYAVIARKA